MGREPKNWAREVGRAFPKWFHKKTSSFSIALKCHADTTYVRETVLTASFCRLFNVVDRFMSSVILGR